VIQVHPADAPGAKSKSGVVTTTAGGIVPYDMMLIMFYSRPASLQLNRNDHATLEAGGFYLVRTLLASAKKTTEPALSRFFRAVI
jgi:hypothetical protein